MNWSAKIHVLAESIGNMKTGNWIFVKASLEGFTKRQYFNFCYWCSLETRCSAGCIQVRFFSIWSTLHVKIRILWSGRVSRHRMSESQPNLVRKRDPIPENVVNKLKSGGKNTTGKGRGGKRHNKAIYKGLFRGKWGDLRLGKLSPESRVDKNGNREHARNSDEERERKRKRRLWEFDFVAWSRNKVNNMTRSSPSQPFCGRLASHGHSFKCQGFEWSLFSDMREGKQERSRFERLSQV